MINQKQIRALLKKMETKFITAPTVSRMLKLNTRKATEMLISLEAEGYIEQTSIDGYWIISLRGKLLVHKKFEREFKVDTLRQQLKDLLERALFINTSVEYPDRIICIKVTSEYPIEQPGKGIRIAYALSRKKITREAYRRAADKLRAKHSGTLGNYTQYLFYPHKAIYIFLKSGSHALKLTEYQDSEIKQLEGTIIFEEMQE